MILLVWEAADPKTINVTEEKKDGNKLEGRKKGRKSKAELSLQFKVNRCNF